MFLPATLKSNMMDEITKRTMWAKAEREACDIFDSNGDASELLGLARRLDKSSNGILRGYCYLWRGFFGAEKDAFSRASYLWQNLAEEIYSDTQDRGWWLHNAVVAELLCRDSKKSFSLNLLYRAHEALEAVDCEPSLVDDYIARQTFSLLRAEICLLKNELDRTSQIIKELLNGVPFRKSLTLELEGVAFSVLQKQKDEAVTSFREAAKHHSLFIHKARCIALAQHLELE